MNRLLNLQEKFQAHLLKDNTDIFDDIVGTEKISPEIRLSIYSHAYRTRLLDALATNYPVLQIYLGHEEFAALAYSYINFYPSHFRSIRWFGDQLEKFLNEHAPYHDFPYLAELAKVEWTMTQVFDAADSELVTLEQLSSVAPEAWVDMQLTMHASVKLLQLSWNVVPVWQAITEDESSSELIKSDRATTWIFWRNNFISYYCALVDDEAAAIGTLLKGHSFGEICEVLCAWIDENEVALRAASLLKGWIAAGLIADIH